MSTGRTYRAFKGSDYCGSLMEMTASRDSVQKSKDAKAKLNISSHRELFFILYGRCVNIKSKCRERAFHLLLVVKKDKARPRCCSSNKQR